MSPVRRRIAAVALASAALSGLGGCHGKDKDESEEIGTSAPVPVELEEARRGPLTGLVTATGIVQPAPDADWTITAPQAARIVELPHAVGDTVPKDALLVRFDSPALRADLATRTAELAQAEARLDNARRSHDRLSGLLSRGIASRKEVEDAHKELLDAEAAVGQAKATRDAAADLAERATAIARFPGLVAERWHNPGDVVDANEHVLRLVDPHHLQVIAAVAVADLPRIVVGRPARVVIPGAPPDSAAKARVASGPAAVEAATGTASVRLALAARLAVGTPVQVEIEAESVGDAVIIPAAAVVREGEAASVFVVDAEKHAHRRPVTLGLGAGSEVQVVKGLEPGEQVVVRGQQELPDGALVTVVT
jgi:cobalt-zinc-cadmium efflux system membrane fusion protein